MHGGANRGYDGVPESHRDATEHRRMLARAVGRLTAGKLNCTFEASLRPAQTTTILSDPRLSPTSLVLWMPRSASASAAERSGIWVIARGKGEATLTHSADAATDQDFTFLVLG
jgi:hypothetical protein